MFTAQNPGARGRSGSASAAKGRQPLYVVSLRPNAGPICWGWCSTSLATQTGDGHLQNQAGLFTAQNPGADGARHKKAALAQEAGDVRPGGRAYAIGPTNAALHFPCARFTLPVGQPRRATCLSQGQDCQYRPCAGGGQWSIVRGRQRAAYWSGIATPRHRQAATGRWASSA